MRYVQVALLIILALASLPVGAVLAQYPEPAGVCTVTPTALDVAPDSVIDLIVTVLDGNGKPIPGVQGSAEITSQPGQGAVLLVSAFTTNATGNATISVRTGSALGNIGLRLKCGPLETVAGVRVGPGALPKPPATGMGGDERSLVDLSVVAVGSLALLLAGSGTLALARRRRTRSRTP